jgi:hypothetical protein
MQYLNYLKYLLKHKWYVSIECFKQGLIWRGLMHDLSKFLPSEFIPYANFFYDKNGKSKTIRDKTGHYKAIDTGDAKFDWAWFTHQKRNKHHWQFWILSANGSGVKIFPIQEPYLTEMFCDMIGASKAQGFKAPKDDKYFNLRIWFAKNGATMQLDESTRIKIEERLKK